jgi:hypothetical protein
MKNLFLLCLGLVLLTSCSKERNFHLRAKNAVTGVPYAGLNYYIVEEREGNNGTDYTTVATGTLDGNGEKLVPVKVRKNRSYVIRLDPPPNWCYMNKVSYSYTIQGDKNPTFDFTFAPCAYLKLDIHNVNCIDNNDEIKFKRSWISGNQTNDFLIQNGCFQYDGDYFSLPAGNYKYEWQVTKNGITTMFDSLFQLSENQYYNFQINY